MNNIDDDKFPLEFAVRICKATGLWKDIRGSDFQAKYYQNEKLKEFQKMAITCTFENSLIAYYGMELEKDHIDGLKIVYGATKSWLKGEVVGALMNKITDKKIANKDFAASIAIIMDQLQESDETENNGKKSNKKELVIRMSQMQDVAEIGKGEK